MIFDGRKLAGEIINSLKQETASWKTKPILAVVSLGAKADNSSYIKQKKETALVLDFGFKHYHFDLPMAASKLRTELNKIAKRKNINGLIIQIPLPKSVNPAVVNVIPVEKDVDLLSDKSVGLFFNGRSAVIPPTPAAILKILEEAQVTLAGKIVAIFGLGKLVGRFLVSMLIGGGATVLIIEKNTPQDLAVEFSLKADIIISAVGESKLIMGDMVKEGAVVIDAGFSIGVDGKLAGDVDFDSVKNRASFITPVPGGVGPVTVAMLYYNLVKLYKFKKDA